MELFMKLFSRGLLAALLLLSAPVLANDISNGSYSTTDGSNTAAPPNGWPAGMAPNNVEPSARANMGATARWWERANPKLATTGSAGAYVLTPSNTSYPTGYTQGEVYCGKANFASVGADTLNVNGLGAKNIYLNLQQIAAYQIQIGEEFCAAYDGALNSSAGGFQLLFPTSAHGVLALSDQSGCGGACTFPSSAGRWELVDNHYIITFTYTGPGSVSSNAITLGPLPAAPPTGINVICTAFDGAVSGTPDGIVGYIAAGSTNLGFRPTDGSVTFYTYNNLGSAVISTTCIIPRS